jgi:hypothetical protein
VGDQYSDQRGQEPDDGSERRQDGGWFETRQDPTDPYPTAQDDLTQRIEPPRQNPNQPSPASPGQGQQPYAAPPQQPQQPGQPQQPYAASPQQPSQFPAQPPQQQQPPQQFPPPQQGQPQQPYSAQPGQPQQPYRGQPAPQAPPQQFSPPQQVPGQPPQQPAGAFQQPPVQPVGAAAPSYGAAPDLGAGAASSEQSESVGRGSGRFIWLGAVAVAVVLLGGAGFFALQALRETGGAASPEEAIDELLLALNQEDFLAVGELLEPAERRTVVEPLVTDILPELERLGVFEEDTDPSQVDGVDIELTDVTYEVEPVVGHDDIVHIYFTGGQSSTTTTAVDLPWGETVRSLAGDDLEDTSSSESIERADTPLVAVERDGRWYLSMWYSLAEAIRLETDADLPDIEDGPTPAGSESPEAAVEAMIQEMVDLDIAGMISRVDPDEGASLYRYSPLFISDAQGPINDFLNEVDASWSVTDLDFDVDADGDDAIVTIVGMTVTVELPDFETTITWDRDRIAAVGSGFIEGESIEFDVEVTRDGMTATGAVGDSVTFDINATFDIEAGNYTVEGVAVEDGVEQRLEATLSIDEDGFCSEYSITIDGDQQSGCLEDELGDQGVNTSTLQDLAGNDDDVTLAGLPMAAHRTDGSWYVSPTLSWMNWITVYLKAIEESDVDTLIEQFESGAGLGFDSMLDGDAFEDAMADNPFEDDPFEEDPFEDDPFEDESFEEEEAASMDDAVESATDGDFEWMYVTINADPGSEPQTIIDEMAAAEVHEYRIAMFAGQTLAVSLRGGSTVEGGIEDPVLSLYDPFGTEEVAFNDDYTGLDSLLSYTAKEDGLYSLLAYELSGGGGGYEIILELDEAGETPSILVDN